VHEANSASDEGRAKDGLENILRKRWVIVSGLDVGHQVMSRFKRVEGQVWQRIWGDCGQIASFQLSAVSFQFRMGAIPPWLTGGRRAGDENIVRKRWVIVWGLDVGDQVMSRFKRVEGQVWQRISADFAIFA
jgi:hypothetical protein